MADIINNAMPPAEEIKAEVPEVMKKAVEEAAAAPPPPPPAAAPAPPAPDASNVVDVWKEEREERAEFDWIVQNKRLKQFIHYPSSYR